MSRHPRKRGFQAISQGDKGEHALKQWAKFSKDLSAITDIELATLKIHIVIEGVLRYLLAARLDVPESVLKDLGFATLLELSLGGIGNGHLLGGIRALNRARNSLSHTLESVDVLHGELDKFVRGIGYMAPAKKTDWPTTSTEQLRVLKSTFDKAGYAIVSLAVAADSRLTGIALW